MLLISGCGGECKVNSDCEAGKCQTAKCENEKCQYTSITNCCGNKVKEELEGGKPGNKCTCQDDYGICTGKTQITKRGKQYDAQYLEYLCENEKCVLSFDKDLVIEIPLVDERATSYFKLESKLAFNKPFNIDNDKFIFEFELKDDIEELKYPIKITKVLFKSGEIFIGEQAVSQEFSKVGDKIAVEVPVAYQPEQPEEEKSVSYKVDYEYTKKIKTTKNEDGSWNYREELVRDSYEKSLKSMVFFVNPGEESG